MRCSNCNTPLTGFPLTCPSPRCSAPGNQSSPFAEGHTLIEPVGDVRVEGDKLIQTLRLVGSDITIEAIVGRRRAVEAGPLLVYWEAIERTWQMLQAARQRDSEFDVRGQLACLETVCSNFRAQLVGVVTDERSSTIDNLRVGIHVSSKTRSTDSNKLCEITVTDFKGRNYTVAHGEGKTRREAVKDAMVDHERVHQLVVREVKSKEEL